MMAYTSYRFFPILSILKKPITVLFKLCHVALTALHVGVSPPIPLMPDYTGPIVETMLRADPSIHHPPVSGLPFFRSYG